MKANYRVDAAATERLVREALPLLHPSAAALFAASTVVVSNCRAGRANYAQKMARIPAWVFEDSFNFCGKGVVEGGPRFAAYYLAHELAHLKARTHGHGAAFMAAFKALCPPELQYYELAYKPRAAAMNGIKARPGPASVLGDTTARRSTKRARKRCLIHTMTATWWSARTASTFS